MNFFISILAYVIAVCMLIIWHEFGHFIVMRLFGIKVLRFSVFFGKPLFRWQRHPGSTEVAIGWLPLGAYVKPLDERDGEVADSETNMAFNRQLLYKRFLAVLAGPAFNFLFAILAFWAIFMIGVPGTRPVIGDVRPDSPAAHAGFVKQDEILSINGSNTPTWEMAAMRLFEGSINNHEIAVRVLTPDHREKQLLLSINNSRTLTASGKLLDGLGLSQFQPQASPEIYKILPGSSAAQAGLKTGDIIEKVGGVPIKGPDQLIGLLRAAPDKILKVQILRNTDTFTMMLPVGMKKSPNGGFIGYLGAEIGYPKSILRQLQVEQRYNPAAAIGQAVVRTGSMTWLTLDAAWNMVIGKVALSNLDGPITIAQYAGYTAENGLVPFLAFLAIVSVSLGVVNLLPIPLLDGGHILYYLIEAIKGSPVSVAAEMIGQRIGIAVILALMSLAIYNDLIRLFG